jgi:hypothetical protein
MLMQSGRPYAGVIASVVVSACCQGVAFSILLGLQSNPALARSDEIQRAVDYCANYARSINVSQDGTVLCFDGPIPQDLQIDGQLQKLNDRGFFVIRSPGGYFPPAMKIADTLLEKDVTVVIRDYCLSACANYIFVATNRTYVLKNSVVAWHGGPAGGNCDRYLEGDHAAVGSGAEATCRSLALRKIFFQKRGIQPGFIYNPPTPYARMMFNILKDPGRRSSGLAPGHRSKIFWMWNPRSYGESFRDRIIYEKYPSSQFDVDRIIDRSRLGIQIVYDPEL